MMMNRQTHPGDHLLLLAMERELPPRRLARVDRHLHTCQDCQARLATMQSALDAFACDADTADGTAGAEAAESRRRLQQAMLNEGQQDPRIRQRLLDAASTRFASPFMRAAAVLFAALRVRTALQHVPVEAFRVAGDSLPNSTMSAQGPLPVASLTPGAVSTLTAAALCAGERPVRVVTLDVRNRVLAEYGMRGVSSDEYELDALVTPELGGTAAPGNLWPQRYSATWNAHVKDALESVLAARVCRQEMALEVAQREIAQDWIAAYKHHFRTDTPLAIHASASGPDDDLIVEGSGSSEGADGMNDTPARPAADVPDRNDVVTEQVAIRS